MSGFDDRLNDVRGVSTFLLRPTGPDNSIGSCNSPWYVHGPGGIGSTGSVLLCGLSCHFVRPSEVWFVLDFL